MAVVGIDLGSQSTKVVILEGDVILGGASLQTGESAETEARMAVQEALRQTGLERGDLTAAVATGSLSVPVTAALNIAALKQRSAASCIATGAHFRFPQARTVLYVGADSSMAVRMSADGQVEDSVKNERCAVSSGALLDIVSRMLEIPVEELGPMSLQANALERVSSRCVVFAEGEILSFIHKEPPVPVPDVLAGVHQSIADGLWGMVQKVGVPTELLLCGGVARNAGIVKAIGAHLGKPPLVPEQPQYVRALGAALFARQLRQEGGAPC
jgi:predicted CoA-substrate-specific enzyme activase